MTQRQWTVTSAIGAACSILGGLAIVASAIWFYAGVSYAAQTIHAHEVRDEVDAEVSKLPDAPPQKVADATPGTAAGELRDAGWVRD